MSRGIYPELAATGKRHVREQSPALVVYRGTRHVTFLHFRHKSLDIVE